MKTYPTPEKTHRLLHLLIGIIATSALMTVYDPTYASDLPARMCPYPKGSNNDTVRSIRVSKSLSSKKSKIQLYPDAKQKVLFFSADGEGKKVYQLYLFDMDGKLVSQASIRNRETTVLENISEGNYLFEVFTDDERIENGNVTVR